MLHSGVQKNKNNGKKDDNNKIQNERRVEINFCLPHIATKILLKSSSGPKMLVHFVNYKLFVFISILVRV